MSIQARQALVANPKLVFQRDSQKADLLDPNMTNTYLIAALSELCSVATHPILITAVRTDHHDDGPNGHAGGFCADAWNADWEQVGDHAVTELMQNAANCEFVWSVGLAGKAQGWAGEIAWPGNPFYWFNDDGDDHVHIAVKSQTGGPGVR